MTALKQLELGHVAVGACLLTCSARRSAGAVQDAAGAFPFPAQGRCRARQHVREAPHIQGPGRLSRERLARGFHGRQ